MVTNIPLSPPGWNQPLHSGLAGESPAPHWPLFPLPPTWSPAGPSGAGEGWRKNVLVIHGLWETGRNLAEAAGQNPGRPPKPQNCLCREARAAALPSQLSGAGGRQCAGPTPGPHPDSWALRGAYRYVCEKGTRDLQTEIECPAGLGGQHQGHRASNLPARTPAAGKVTGDGQRGPGGPSRL